MEEGIKIVDAFWEKRNLGVSVTEVILPKNTAINELQRIQELESDLVYVKVHYENREVIEKLTDENFKYIENQFSIQKKLKKFSIDQIYERTISFLDCVFIDTLEGAEVLLDELDKNIFVTDRIALDPYFGVELANIRYKNWIRDMISSGDYECVVLKTKQDSIPVGFYINRYKKNTANCVLGAVFEDFKNRAVGHSFIYFSLKNAIERNCKILRTQISSNNMSVFNIYSSVFGFEITDNFVVLKKRL